MTDLTDLLHGAKALGANSLPTALERAQDLITSYRRRNALFAAQGDVDLFADPCWHMLLDLFIAAKTGKSISVSSLCIASLSPQTTALRHIGIMVKRGLMTRTPDAEDNRRIYLSLSPKTLAMMESILG